MLNHITRGQVAVALGEYPASTLFYLPHQSVKKEKHGKTKWRIVLRRELKARISKYRHKF
jgi:hypothetical protein